MPSYCFADAQRSLIKPFERVGFIIRFVLVSVLAEVLTDLLTQQAAFSALWMSSPIQYGIAAGIVSGSILGAAQWLVLRPYVPSWHWIFVTGLSITFSITIQTTYDVWIESLRASQQVSPQAILSGAIMAILASIGSIFIYGYLQWYVLRPYVAKARWWIFIPLISVITLAILVLIFSNGFVLISARPHGYLRSLLEHLYRFDLDTIKLSIIPATQAVCFCLLHKKHVSENPAFQSPLALAPDIKSPLSIQKLKKLLYSQISQIWKTDLATEINSLTYLVGVNDRGRMIAYEPLNPASIEHIAQTPLPKLTHQFERETAEATLPDLAKFQVVFTPPATVQIQSWRGVPIVWLAAALYLAIIGINFALIWFRIDLLPSR